MIALWLTPLLLLALPAQVMTNGRHGLWLGLAVVSGPLLFSSLKSSLTSSAEDLLVLPCARLALSAGAALHLIANLGLIGELAGESGLPRWSGVMVGTLIALFTLRGEAPSRMTPAWMTIGLVALFIPLIVVMGKTGANPLHVFRETASQTAFRFEAKSAWVLEGRSLPGSARAQWIEFSEEHHLTVVNGGVVRVAYSDGGRKLIEERTLSEGQKIVVRPGDRLQTEPGVRLRFEPEKRIPHAPLNGTEWASAPALRESRSVTLLFGLALTLLGGAMAWPSFFSLRSFSMSRRRLLLASSGLLLVALLGGCWGVYAARFAPELYLDGVRGASILRLPIVALHLNGVGQWLVVFAVIGVFMAFLASVPALGVVLTRGVGCQEHRALSLAIVAGIGVLAAVLAVPPWELALLGFGLGAVTLAPLLLVDSRQRWANAIAGVALLAYIIVAVIARLPLGALLPESVLRFPALGVLPVVIVLFALTRRRARAPGRSSERVR